MPSNKHRSINERWVIKGRLVLQSPANFGNGDVDPLTDMPLLMDELESERPLLPGTSIAGALRSYLLQYAGDAAANLFGSDRDRGDEGEQSPLIVFDALGNATGVELRDGVKIDPKTRTAEDGKKFDMQLLAAGTTFDLRFDLLVSDKQDGKALRTALATALMGLETGEITLGARKQRGFGAVKVEKWQVYCYNLKDKAGLLDWLASGHDWRSSPAEQAGESLLQKLDVNVTNENKRESVRLCATFGIDGTLLIRSGFGPADMGPDTVHLHSLRGGKKVPVIPGTSWAGVLRQRALKIARTVSEDAPISKTFVDGIFGAEVKQGEKQQPKAGRIRIAESAIEQAESLVVTRVKIDRFTGGAFESALFTEQPLVGNTATNVTLDLTLRSAQPAELGLLLLLLKDLWTGDLPVGGESGVGRGRLKGLCATLKTPSGDWTFEKDGEKIKVTPETETLEAFVTAFNLAIKEQVKA